MHATPGLPFLSHAQTWALVLDRLQRYVAGGSPQPAFPAVSA